MNAQHWLLVALWIGYCAFHSLLALPSWKRWMSSKMGSSFRFYRLSYSIFAAASLIFVLFFQFNISSPRLWERNNLVELVVLPFLLSGAIIMSICIYKYFFDLSGIDVLTKRKASGELQQHGMHRFVRHPLYFGTLLFIWALFFLFPYLDNLIAAVIISLYTIAGAKLEEKKLTEEFGEVYKEYRKRVPMLIPGFKV
jgi:protein-S-isoprenylcysteine O-methyltransferase Ste14